MNRNQRAAFSWTYNVNGKRHVSRNTVLHATNQLENREDPCISNLIICVLFIVLREGNETQLLITYSF